MEDSPQELTYDLYSRLFDALMEGRASIEVTDTDFSGCYREINRADGTVAYITLYDDCNFSVTDCVMNGKFIIEGYEFSFEYFTDFEDSHVCTESVFGDSDSSWDEFDELEWDETTEKLLEVQEEIDREEYDIPEGLLWWQTEEGQKDMLNDLARQAASHFGMEALLTTEGNFELAEEGDLDVEDIEFAEYVNQGEFSFNGKKFYAVDELCEYEIEGIDPDFSLAEFKYWGAVEEGKLPKNNGIYEYLTVLKVKIGSNEVVATFDSDMRYDASR